MCMETKGMQLLVMYGHVEIGQYVNNDGDSIHIGYC